MQSTVLTFCSAWAILHSIVHDWSWQGALNLIPSTAQRRRWFEIVIFSRGALRTYPLQVELLISNHRSAVFLRRLRLRISDSEFTVPDLRPWHPGSWFRKKRVLKALSMTSLQHSSTEFIKCVLSTPSTMRLPLVCFDRFGVVSGHNSQGIVRMSLAIPRALDTLVFNMKY